MCTSNTHTQKKNRSGRKERKEERKGDDGEDTTKKKNSKKELRHARERRRGGARTECPDTSEKTREGGSMSKSPRRRHMAEERHRPRCNNDRGRRNNSDVVSQEDTAPEDVRKPTRAVRRQSILVEHVVEPIGALH